MNPRIVINIIIVLAAFGAGWVSNGWRKNNEVLSAVAAGLEQDIKDRDDVIKATNSKLNEVLTKVGDAAALANSTANKLQTLNTQHVTVVEGITKRTQGLNNEIAKLQPANCVLNPDVGRMYERAGEAANAPRRTLYGSQDSAKD